MADYKLEAFYWRSPGTRPTRLLAPGLLPLRWSAFHSAARGANSQQAPGRRG